jgi:MurNAc alpha-1-phosphate uridylyltransferase
VAGKALLDHALDRVRAAGIGRAVVNVHYLADALEAHVRRRDQDIEITISNEREQLLETGGGLVKALPLIDADPFLVVNSDNLWVDGPADSIRSLAARWDDATMDALLLLVPLARANCHNGRGDFHMDGAGQLSRRKPGRIAPFVFTGVQIVSKRLFEGARAEPFSLNVLWDRAIGSGRAFGMVHNGLWFDVGTPPAVKRTEAMLASE